MSERTRDAYAEVGEATRVAVERAMPGLTLPEARVMLAFVRQLTSWSILGEAIAARQLGEATGMDDRAVRRAVATLAARGAIIRQASPGRRASVYRLPRADGANAGDTDQGSEDHGSPQPGSDDTLNPGRSDPLNPGQPDHLPEDYARTTPEDSSRRTSPPAPPDPSSPAWRLCEQLADSIAERGSKRPIVTDTWLRDMVLLLRRDGRSEDDVAKVVRWLSAAADDTAQFWAPNIRSPRKLREKWDHMREQYDRSKARSNGHRLSDDEIALSLARHLGGQ